MRLLQCIKRLVVFAFVVEVTSHPTPYGSRLINFLGSGSVGAKPIVRCGNNNNNNNNNDGNCLHGRRYHNQKNIGTGSDSSLVEISFQPLRELESVSSLTSFYPLARKQFFLNDDNDDDDDPSHQAVITTAAKPHHHHQKNPHIDSQRQRRTGPPRHHQPINNIDDNSNNDDDNFQTYHQRYPDQAMLSSIDGPTTPVAGALNGIPYPVVAPAENGETEEAEDPFGFMHRDTQNSNQSGRGVLQGESETLPMESFPWDVFKEKSHPAAKDLTMEVGQSYIDSTDVNNKRNALVAFKRQKFKTHQSQFTPSISGGAVSNLGEFFENFRNNVEFMHKSRLSNSEEVLLEGDHPLQMFKEELLNSAKGSRGASGDGSIPSGTAAFLHAIRNYRPSQRIRSLVALNPEGYHGSQFLDPNYMWLGLGKR